MLYARKNAVTHEHGIPGGVAGNSLCKQLQNSNMGMEQKHPHLTQRTGGGDRRVLTRIFSHHGSQYLANTVRLKGLHVSTGHTPLIAPF